MKNTPTTLIVIFILSFLALVGNVNSQSVDNPINFTPKSPEAINFDIYGDIQNNGNNGLPDITIPIHTIVVDNLEIPISISYTADGVKVNDVPTAVGLKWALNAGGMFSRDVSGLPDEYSKGWKSSFLNERYDEYVEFSDGFCKKELDFYSGFHSNQVDISPDFFSYAINGMHGQLIIKRDGNHMEGLQSNNIIDKDSHLNYFDLKDSQGNKFIFSEKEEIIIHSQANGQTSTSMPATNGWKLSKATTQLGDSIVFSYEEHNYSTGMYVTGHSVKKTTPNTSPPVPGCGNLQTNQTNIIYRSKLIKSIKTDFEMVTFHYDSCDNCAVLNKRLKRIIVQNINDINDTIKIVEFQHDNFSGHQRLKLTGLTVLNKDSAPLNNYTFEYVLDEIDLPQYGSFSQDVFGYYNGAQNQYHMLPMTVPDFPYGAADREVNHNTIAIGALEKIIYPTGGFSKFYYEPNYTMGSNGPAVYYPGIRVKKIEDYTEDTKLSREKVFEYGAASTTVPYFPGDFSHFIDPLQAQGDLLYKHTIYSSTRINPFFQLYPRQIGFGYDKIKTIYPGNGSKIDRFDQFFEFNRYYWLPTESIIFNNENDTLSIKNKNYIFTQFRHNSDKPIGKEFFFELFSRPFIPINYFSCGDKDYCFIPESYFCPNPMTYYPPIRTSPFVQSNRKELESQTTIDFFDGEKVKTVTSYQYNEKQLLREQQITRIDENDQEFESETTHFRYITDHDVTWIDTNIKDSLINSNFISKPLLTTKHLNDAPPFEGVMTYVNGLGQTIKLKTLETNGSGALEDFSWHGEFTYGGSKHRLVNSETLEGHSRYIWDSNQQYLLAQINNLSSEEDIPNLSLIEGLNNFSGDLTSSQMDSLVTLNQEIRDLPDSIMITTYTHKPLVGVTSITDPRGRSVFYEYDSFNRLIRIRDHDQNILEENEYHYAE